MPASFARVLETDVSFMVTCLLPRAPASAWSSLAKRTRSFSSASDKRVYTGRTYAGSCRFESRGSALPARQASSTARSKPTPVGIHREESRVMPGCGEQIRVFPQRVTRDEKIPRCIRAAHTARLDGGGVPGGANVRLDDAIAPETRHARVIQIEFDRVHLFAHGIGHHQDATPNTRRLRVPCDGVEGRNPPQDPPRAPRRRP